MDAGADAQRGHTTPAPQFTLSADVKAQIREAAANLLTHSFASLNESNVLPTSRYRPWIRVGRDYEGTLVFGSEEESFTKTLQAALPDRFNSTASSIDWEWNYPFALLEAAVAAATLADDPPEVNSASVQRVINELIDKLQAIPRSTVLQLVTDIDVEQSAASEAHQDQLRAMIAVGGVRVIPVENWAERFIDQELPSAGYEVQRSDVVTFPGPQSLIVATEEGFVDETTRVMEARRRVENLVAAIRLATGSTARVMIDIQGDPDPVPRSHPVVTPTAFWDPRWVYRPVTLSKRDKIGLSHLASLVDTWTNHKDWVAVNIAMGRLTRSLDSRTTGIVDDIVDIAVGLEAALGGNEKTEIGLRLRTRSANILATDADPSDAIYRDVKTLYQLRSTFVHGGTLSAKDAAKAIASVSTAAAGKLPAEQSRLAVDRWRDLLRRAILARVALTTATTPWPIKPKRGGTFDVDELLLRETDRHAWRRHVAEFWAEQGLPHAPNPPRPALLRMGNRSDPS